jgi:hypothetical protein
LAEPQPPIPEHRPDQARNAAEEILARDEYQGPGSNESLLERFRDWLQERLPDDESTSLDVPDWTSFVLLTLLFAGAVAAIAAGLRRTRRRRLRPADEPGGDVEVTPLLSVREWEAEERRLEAAGDHRGAVRARYRATVGLLAERDLLDDLPGRTPAEFAAEVTERLPAAAADFAALADLVNRVWFGQRPAGSGELAVARESAAAVADRAPRRGAPLAEARS